MKRADSIKDFLLQTDVSDRAVGAILSQADENVNDHLIAYFSKRLVSPKRKIFNHRKKCLHGYGTWNSGISCLLDGQTIHNANRPLLTRMARLTQREQCTFSMLESGLAPSVNESLE